MPVTLSGKFNQSHRELIASEAKTLREIRQALLDESYRLDFPEDELDRIAEVQKSKARLIAALIILLLAARRRARAGARRQLLREYGLPGEAHRGKLDQLAAESAAQSLANAWAAANIGRALSDERPLPPRQLDARARRIATTETATAWNDEHRALSEGIPGALNRWDATLDARTCRVCRSMDGVTVPVGSPFPEGEPGFIHPNCRCISTLIAGAKAA